MEYDGEIVAILNESYLIVKATKDFREDIQLEVFQEINDPKLANIDGLEKVIFPKGLIRIIREQGAGLYLASVTGEKKVRKTIHKGSDLARSLSPFSSLFGASEEVEEIVSVAQAVVDSSQSLKLIMPSKIQIGDKVVSRGPG